MEHYSSIIQTISLALGASWASGINLYATTFILGFSALSGVIFLPEGLAILTNPLIIAISGLMYCVEFFADKIPGVDTVWDSFHTFVRIPAGVLLAAGAFSDKSMLMMLIAAILGTLVTTATHAAKVGSRVLINTSFEPFTNWGASLSEDLVVFAGLWMALNYPALFLIIFVLFILVIIWILPKIWQGVRNVFLSLIGLFQKRRKSLHVENKKEEK
jgi:hypothetical protein